MVKLGIRRLAVINQSGEIVGVLSFDNLVDGSRWKCPISVSYTHLTLPTILRV